MWQKRSQILSRHPTRSSSSISSTMSSSTQFPFLHSTTQVQLLTPYFHVIAYNGSVESKYTTSSHGVQQMLTLAGRDHRTQEHKRNVDLVLKFHGPHAEDYFTLSHLMILGPENGNACVRSGCAWVTLDPTWRPGHEFDDWAPEKGLVHGLAPPDIYFVTNELTRRCIVPVSHHTSGKYLVIRLIDAHPQEGLTPESLHPSAVIDVSFVGILGLPDECIIKNAHIPKEIQQLRKEQYTPQMDMEDTFAAIDANHDGFITAHDFLQYMREHEHPYWSNKNHVQQLFRFADADSDSKLSFEEFKKWYLKEYTDEEIFENEFRKLDANGDGYVSLEDLRKNYSGKAVEESSLSTESANSTAHPITIEHLQKLLQQMDIDQDGRVSREDLRTFFERVNQSRHLEQQFQIIDQDMDGVISFDELHAWFTRAIRVENWTREQTAILYNYMATPDDAKIRFQEFKRFAQHYQIVFKYYFE